MQKFLTKILLFITIICISLFLLSLFFFGVIGQQYRFSYNASLIDKVERLENINSPKIILVTKIHKKTQVKTDHAHLMDN